MSLITASDFPGRSRLKYLWIFLIVSLLANAAKAERPADYGAAQAYEFARQLVHEHRYQEAEVYLTNKLQFLPLSSDRLPFLLLLTETQLEVEDAAAALNTINDAYRWADSERDSTRIGKLRHSAMVINQQSYRDTPRASDTRSDTLNHEAADPSPHQDLRITNTYYETDLGMILSDLSIETGIPIFWSPMVEGLVTYEANDQPIDKLLNSILLPLGYAYVFTDDKYIIGSLDPTDPSFTLISITDVVQLTNIKASAAVNTLPDIYSDYVKASDTGNKVFITAPESLVKRIKADILAMDEPPVQVSIEVIVAEITHTGQLQLGVDWSASNRDPNHARLFSTSSPQIDTPSSTLEIVELGGSVGGELVDVSVSLNALLASGDARIRANPRITTMNGRTASIRLIRDEYFIIQTSQNQYYAQNTLQSITSGIILEITPLVSDTKEITLYLRPQVGDVIGEDSEGLPQINTRAAETTVRINDGDTFTIGGLSLEVEDKQQRKIPLLGSIPFLGYFFRYTQDNTRDSEIVIFVTPHVLEG